MGCSCYNCFFAEDQALSSDNIVLYYSSLISGIQRLFPFAPIKQSHFGNLKNCLKRGRYVAHVSSEFSRPHFPMDLNYLLCF